MNTEMLFSLELGEELHHLAADQAAWSQETFGSDDERGPLDALLHLEKEAREAAAAPNDHEEYADCFLLILDAARRSGISPIDLVRCAQKKMAKNRCRTWPQPIDGMPVEHVR